MRLKDLAAEMREIRQPIGFFADGPRTGYQLIDLANASDEYLIKVAARCSLCGASPSQNDIKRAISRARDIDSFGEFIDEKTEHKSNCPIYIEMVGEGFVPFRKPRKAKKKASTKRVKNAKAVKKKKDVKKKTVKAKKKVSKKAAKRPKRK